MFGGELVQILQSLAAALEPIPQPYIPVSLGTHVSWKSPTAFVIWKTFLKTLISIGQNPT